MGMIFEGQWSEQDDIIKDGKFVRAASTFDHQLSQSVIDEIATGSKRYILVASLSCPWSHRTVLVRNLKNLQELLPVHVAGGPRLQGYGLLPTGPLNLPFEHVHQLYTQSEPKVTGRSTVPILWDSRLKKVVSNDSAKIMCGLDQVQTQNQFTLTPTHLETEIENLNDTIHKNLANAVYRAGLAQNQSAYDEAVEQVFAMLDTLDDRLANQRLLFDNTLTQTDIRLFTTLVRFDAVYGTLFRCTRKRLVDYKHLWPYARDLYHLPGIAETVDFKAILDGYYSNDGTNNPHAIIAEQPQTNWQEPSNRQHLGEIVFAGQSENL